MKHSRYSLLFIALFSIGLTLPSWQSAFGEVPEGFKPLFNGKDLSGWKGLAGNPKSRAKMQPDELAKLQAEADARMKTHWKVVDEVIEFDGKGKNLCTEKDYSDFELYVDWKITAGGDSGIYLRGSPQVNIWDTTIEKYKRLQNFRGSGNLYNNKNHQRHALVHADNPIGEWNTFYIRLVGERLLVKLNGKVVADNIVMENYWERDKPLYRKGTIELQNHGNPLWFKNISIREIKLDEANKILNEIHDEGFESVFNGKDFTGWGGPIDQYEVKDGAVVCKPNKGGHIHTKKEYANFVAKLEFKLPPGGNNGLAIRYPGTGNAHKAGMTEIQILDSEHPKYAKLHATQYHGSVYGLVPAHRGYLRPTGEWNFQTVKVDGSRITVELNGSTILDADLMDVKKAKDGKFIRTSTRKVVTLVLQGIVILLHFVTLPSKNFLRPSQKSSHPKKSSSSLMAKI